MPCRITLSQLADRSISPSATKCLHQINRHDVIINLLVWISGVVKPAL